MFSIKNRFTNNYIIITGIIIVNLIITISANSQDTLTLGIHPYLPIDQLTEKFTPLANYLSKEIDKAVIIKIGTDYNDHVLGFENGEVELAFMGPAAFVKLTNDYEYSHLVGILETNGTTYFSGTIFSNEKSEIYSLNDINNKTLIAFVDKYSTMGYIIPNYVILKSLNKTSYLRNTQFLGSHNNVALGVLYGDYEVGTTKKEVFDKYKSHGLRNIGNTPDIPEHVFVVQKNIEPKLLNRIQTAFNALNDSEKGILILKNINPEITGIRETSMEVFNQLKEIMKLEK